MPTTPPTSSAAACSAHQLKASGQGPGDTEDDGVIVELLNVSRHTCLLKGTVHASLYGPGTSPRTITGLRGPFGWSGYDMAPGESTFVWFRATAGCETGPVRGPDAIPVTRVTVAVPGGGSISVGGLNMPRTCHGPTVSAFYRRPPDPVYPPSPLAGAAVTIEAPKTVHAGTTLTFAVVIANRTARPLSMQPCPSFTEFLSTRPDKVFYALNCHGRTQLARGARLRFEMRLEVPAQALVGPAKLWWSLNNFQTGPPPSIVTIVAPTRAKAHG